MDPIWMYISPSRDRVNPAQPLDLAPERGDSLAGRGQLGLERGRKVGQAGNQQVGLGKRLIASRQAGLNISHGEL